MDLVADMDSFLDLDSLLDPLHKLDEVCLPAEKVQRSRGLYSLMIWVVSGLSISVVRVEKVES